MDDDAAFCCRCKEDFLLAAEPTAWRMGELRSLVFAPAPIRREFSDWATHPDGHYLCGNCYFDLTD
jgi:hypothetical protein